MTSVSTTTADLAAAADEIVERILMAVLELSKQMGSAEADRSSPTQTQPVNWRYKSKKSNFHSFFIIFSAYYLGINI